MIFAWVKGNLMKQRPLLFPVITWNVLVLASTQAVISTQLVIRIILLSAHDEGLHAVTKSGGNSS